MGRGGSERHVERGPSVYRRVITLDSPDSSTIIRQIGERVMLNYSAAKVDMLQSASE